MNSDWKSLAELTSELLRTRKERDDLAQYKALVDDIVKRILTYSDGNLDLGWCFPHESLFALIRSHKIDPRQFE